MLLHYREIIGARSEISTELSSCEGCRSNTVVWNLWSLELVSYCGISPQFKDDEGEEDEGEEDEGEEDEGEEDEGEEDEGEEDEGEEDEGEVERLYCV
jgi:hypothetical protein